MKPLDFFEETEEINPYKTFKALLVFITIVLYILIPTIIVLLERPLGFNAFVLILIGLIPFTILNFFCSSLIFAFFKILFWVLAKTLTVFRIDPLVKLFKSLQLKLDIIVISFFLNVVVLAFYLQKFAF